MFPSRALLDYWCEAAGLAAAGSVCGLVLVRRGRRLVNAGERDFPIQRPAPPEGGTGGPAPAPAPAVDLLVIHDLAAEDPVVERLQRRFPDGRFVPTYPCLAADLGSDPASYVERRLSSRRRRDLRRLRRKLASLGRLELTEVEPTEVDRFLPRFLELIEERAVQRRSLDRNLFRHPYLSGLWRRFVGGELLVSALLLDGVPISFRSGFVDGGAFLGYMPVADAAFSRFSLGHLHLAEMMPALAARGLTVYDFGKGVEANKEVWAERRYQLGDFVAPLGRGPGSRARLAASRTRAALRDALYTPARLRWLRRWRFTLARWRRPRLRRAVRRADRGGVPLAGHELAPLPPPVDPFSYQRLADLPLPLRAAVVDEAFRLSPAPAGLRLAVDSGRILLDAPQREERLGWRFDAE